MWVYEKRLQFPVKITKTCPKTAQMIISQYGGPDGELSASMRYLAQRYSMPVKEVGGLLTDIGTEELAHMEIICAMVYQLTKHLTIEQAKEAGFDAYYIDHTTCLLYTSRRPQILFDVGTVVNDNVRLKGTGGGNKLFRFPVIFPFALHP